jgi:biotin transport system substrate-specific component
MSTGILTRTLARPITRHRTLDLVIWTGAFVAAMALSAQVRIHLPFTPVPITLQTFFVLLAGLMLGPGRAALAMGAYLAVGAAGLPVFAGAGFGPAYLSGATAGYLLACPPAAYLTGLLAGERPGTLRAVGAASAGALLILVAGTLWLALLTGASLAAAASLGLVPFLVGDALKVLLVAETGRRIGRRI